MSLHWNAEKVPAKIREQYAKDLERAIWNSMVIGIPAITEKNLAEAIHRTRLWEEINGATRYSADGRTEIYLWKSLHLFVGLKTNAVRRTRTQFLRLLWDNSIEYTQVRLDFLATGKMTLPMIAA